MLAVGGPEALTPLEVVKIFEEESGRRFEVETIPEAKLREQFDSANDSLEKSFAGLMLQYAHGDAIDMRGLLESIPVRLTSVREYARTVLEPYKRASADAPTALVVNAPHIVYVDIRSGTRSLARSLYLGSRRSEASDCRAQSLHPCPDGPWRGFTPALTCRKSGQPYRRCRRYSGARKSAWRHARWPQLRRNGDHRGRREGKWPVEPLDLRRCLHPRQRRICA